MILRIFNVKEFLASTHGSQGIHKTARWLASQSFCWWDILRVQLKSYWTVGEGMLVADQSQFDNGGEFYLMDAAIFLNA